MHLIDVTINILSDFLLEFTITKVIVLLDQFEETVVVIIVVKLNVTHDITPQ
jgi:hypothetical protein